MRAVVIIAEKRVLSDCIDMFSNELDFSSDYVTGKILEAFKNHGITTYYYDSPKSFLDNVGRHQQDIVFSTLWGGYHSRSKRSLIAAICEAYQICYIGADAFVQALCQDKYLTKSFLRDFSFSIPRAILIQSPRDIKKLEQFSCYPCIVKPNDEGCSVGISNRSVAHTPQEARTLIENLIPHYAPILVEEFISGSEISVCCAGVGPSPDILEAVQLVVDGQTELEQPWGFESKKAGQSVVTREIVTERFPRQILDECERLFLSLGKVDLMRIDGKFYNDRFYIIELSPDCSLHPSCFMATAFAHNGYSYEQTLVHLANASWERFSSGVVAGAPS